MSEGHKHRYVNVKYPFVWKLLSKPTVFYRNDTKKMLQSRFVYSDRYSVKQGRYKMFFRWKMSLLGFLHGLCGLTLKVDGDK